MQYNIDEYVNASGYLLPLKCAKKCMTSKIPSSVDLRAIEQECVIVVG